MFARTERLLLRPGWLQDAPALHRALADEGVIRNLASAPWPYAIEDAEAFLATERSPKAPALLVFRRTDGEPELVGTCGFGPAPGGGTEIGYWIARPHWNQGYATEAGRALLDMARTLGLPRLSGGHFLDNPASGRVLEKLGFRPTGQIVRRYSAGRGEAGPCKLYELRLAGEAKADPDAVEAAPAMMAA
jgi:RimJ/RimL family protein N-acetyltransferase